MKKVTIIAEAGVNHNGDIEIAKKLIDVASSSGADYVKFQTFNADRLVSKLAQKANYQIQATGSSDSSQYSMIKKLELKPSHHQTLIDHCKERNIKFLSTPFDGDSIDFLESLNINLFKIPSGEITNLPYLRKIGQKKKPVILSTGMSSLGEIEKAIDVLAKAGVLLAQITILHCNTEYPTPFVDVNLKAMETIKAAFGVEVGYSDHTLGIEVPIAAVALGASVIEKHFTLSRKLDGPDHLASLEPNELNAMVKAIRNIEQAISGNGIKAPSTSEKKNLIIARKSIHLAKPIKSGEVITAEHLIPLRPGDGLSPMVWDSCVGQKATKDLDSGHKLSWIDLK